uniref:Dystonin n=1 Tax=Pygocentrus nattereri TaxID=42514 RepID=A0AAR2IUR3_PYGNA
MIAAAFLVLLRPLSLQCVLLLLLLLLGTVATILFLCCWHRRLRHEKIPIKSVLARRSRSREAGLRSHHFRSEGFRHSPRHVRRSARVRVSQERPLMDIPESDPDSTAALRKRKVKKRVQPEFYHSVQVTPTRKPSSGSASLRCSMSSSADFSDDDDSSLKSGSVSPAPGDTLPWNLPRHERSKRKIQGGSVLDPAERAVLRIADERDRVQKKTFTKWINQHLLKVRKHVNDLYEDLRDGHNLISLLEVLSGDTLPRERDFLKTLRLVSAAEACAVERHGRVQDDDDDDEDKGPREKGRMRFHRLQNVQIALDYLKRRQVKLVNIRNDDITDGNPKLTLGLIWTIILHFQISDIHVTGESEDMTAKERLLLWSQQMTEGYVGVRCDNFTTSWRDGRLFNALIHKYRPDLVDMSKVSAQSTRSNLEHAFCVAEQLGVARLLDPEDVDVSSPDEKSVITYVSTLYDVFPKVPEGVEGINANDVDIKWVEYQNMVNYLSQWIKHNVSVMSDRNFPSNPVELKALYSQYLHFKESEIPLKENEKTKIKHLYKMLEVWIEFGRIQLPQGYHPNDVEKEWGKLIVAMLEREKSLRPEVDRLEMLQQIANRVHRDCVAGEDKLALARASLQSDAKRLESGIQFQNEAEVAGYLLECENLLRQQVVDIQILLDGKFYLADQLVQRVSKLRDDLLALRTECSSVYSKGRTLTSEQTKIMISGITQSLNSGFSQNLNPSLSPALTPALTPGALVTPGSTLSSSLTPVLTPAMTPALTPGLQPTLVGGGNVETGVLQHLKQMQIRKPMLKSSLVDPNLSEEEVNMKFVQDLLNWVEEMQVQLDRGEWGSDLPSVESHLENHRNVHKAIEDFQMSLKEAKISEIQMTQPLKQSYSEKLGNLENQYGRLLNCSRERQKHLDSLHDFVSHATEELIWLNEKEEEEVAFDWSERNSNVSRKKDYHAELMRELDKKEGMIKSVQDQADSLLQQNHPARLTIEAYKAAMQTQWSWILQLCYCVEQHLKENTVYFEFFNDAKESMDYLKSLQDSISRKYSCDRTSGLHRLEDLIQESMDEKEQLLQYRSTVAGLVGRAKSIVQLKPRNPEYPIRTSIPVKAICDYRQIEITIYKEDECVLASNSHRAKWKVISPSGNEAMVPSVCFSVPAPNKEAVDMASRIEQLYQNVLALWHRSHINMKSVVSWHYLMMDIRTIRKSTVASIKTMLPGEHQQVLSSLQSHFEEFLEDSEESEVFTVADCAQLEREVLASKEYYEELLKSAEREEHEESVYNLFISEVRNFRMRVEAHEEQLIRHIRTPLDRDDLQASMQRINEQERKKAELDRLKEDLEVLKEKCEVFLRQAANSPSVPTLSSELSVLTQSMAQVYSMCSIYLEKLKAVSLVVKHSQSAEALVKLYEAKLCEEDAVNADIKSIDAVMSTLKQWRSEIDDRREVFHDLEDELQKARVISDRMFKTHNERDFDLDWHKEKAEQLGERWRNVHSQIENRLRDLEGISKSLRYYKDTYSSLDEWSKEMEANQLKTQENQPEDSKALAELLNQQKVLVAEIERKQSKIDECQKYSEQYSAGVKDYELQLMTYRAMVDSQHKSPVKRRRMQSSSDAIQQEFMDLRTRYTALVTLMTQYVKFASETLKRAEEDEVGRDIRHLTVSIESFQQEKSLSEQKIKSLKNELENLKDQLQKAKDDMRFMAKTYAIEFLEAQAATGALIDPITGECYTALDAFEKGIIGRDLKDKITEADKAVSILNVRSGAILSVCRSVQNGLIDQSTGLSLLEAQLITSELILPEFRMCLDLEDAFKHNLVDGPMYEQLQDLNGANRSIQEASYASEPLPVVAAVNEGAISERLAIKIIEIQLATGGLRVTYTGECLSLERAFQFGLIPHSFYVKILERQNSWKDLIDPNTAEKVSLIQLMQRSIVHEETGLRLLPVKSGKDGTISLTSGREISILRAVHEGLIDRETMIRLLSAQLFAGGIVDPKTNRKLTVEEALSEGLIDQDTASGILSHQSKNGGIVNPHNGARLTVDEAVQCDLMSSRSALLVLERQKCFMGLLWPHSGEILTVSTSVQHEIITDKLASELLCHRHKIAALYIPENSEVVDIDSATRNGLIDTYTKELLKTLEIPDTFPDVDNLNDRFSTWLVMREVQLEGSQSTSDEMEVGERSISAHSSSEFKQLFISYLMMNSYMDPKSGQRLLIFDGQLNKMAKLLLEVSDSGMNDPSQVVMHDSPVDENFSENALELHATCSKDLGIWHIEKPLTKISEETDSEISSLETQLAAFPGILTPDMGIAELLLNSADELTPTQIHQDLAAVFVDLQNTFSDVCQLSAERSNAILQAIDAAKVSDLEKNLSGTRQHLEDTAFDVQYFISEHAQFLSPAQNRQLLKSLSATQRAFKELMDRVFTQRHTLDLHLEIREDEREKQKEFVAKLQEMCDDLTQTENRLIGHQQQAVLAKSVGDLQQYQQEHQKDIQANASALNEVISSTKKFLEENRSKLTPEQITAIEVQLEEAKSKANMLNQRAEESRKDLEKVMTTAIKQETEKVAAVEQLEESKNKIEGLLDWISNIGKEKEMEGMQKDQVSKQNGNMAVDTQGKRLIGHNDDPNGNELDSTDNSPEWSGESEDSRELDLNQQYEKVKSHHQEILSQQQDLIIATQSAQALLDKQAGVLSPAEKEKLQRDIQELRSRYEASLTRAEQQIKQLQSIQEELRKFQGDSAEFESWLQHAQEQVEELGAPAGQLEVLQEKLQKQKSFYEDVISHKGDLRFITISGQKVLDVAKTCSQGESGDKEALPEVDTSGTCATVKEKLDSATARYKALHTQCNQLGTNLKDVVDKYKKYEDATGGLLTWLNNSEEEARRQLSEPIAADPQTLQRQLEDTKALQGQTTGHQTAVEMLRKIADALIAVEGDLLTNQDEIQEAVDDIVERYDNLSKSVSDRNEKLQVTLTRSLSVQDGLDEMMNWMEKVEESLEKEAHVPLDSDTIADALSKEAALEQDISSRQSSISTMKAKVKKFAETAEPAAAALLQTKMEGLSQRFTDACEKHKKKVSQMEELKEKVEQFEKTSEKVQQFVLKRSQALCETDGPGKNVNELSQLVQDTNEELAEHVKDMETLQMLSKELSSSGLEGSKALIQGKMANLSNTFNAFRDTIKEKEEEVLSCQDQLGDFKAAAGVLMKWLEETKEQVPAVQPNCSEQSLGKDLHKGLLEEWTAKAPAVQDINSKGSALCSLISVLTSPAKAKMHHKSGIVKMVTGQSGFWLPAELMLVQQNMSCVSEGYRNLGDLLKGRSSELNALLQKVRGAHDEAESMLQWLEDMKKTAASWSSEPTVKDSVKTQMEQQKVDKVLFCRLCFKNNQNVQKSGPYQELREKVLHLIEENPDSPEAAKWKHMLDQIGMQVVGSVENRKQHLEESSRVLELFQTTQTQLSQWLQEKELMMSVLGPLSMDPNMLNTQKQQVQILLKEFEGRKPQYEQLNEAAVAITSTSGKQDPAVEKVKEKVVAITQKWQGLTGQLSQRDALIEQAVGKTTQYQELLRRLGESAAVLESQLSGQQALSTQPDAVKKQLEDTNAILSQLCEEKKRLKEAERLCSELSNLVTEEYLKANLTKQLESVSKPFKLLEDKAGKRIRQLNSAFASSQQFHQMSKNFKDWLDQKLQEQAEPQSISAKVETLSENLKEHSAVQRALSEHEESYSTIMKEGEALLQSTEGAEKVALQGQLSVLKSNWEEVKRSAAEREEKLNTVMERAQKYKEHAENLSSWLKECDERQNKVKFSVNPVEVDNSLSQVKAIQKDVDKHRGQMELLSTASDSLLEVATEDVDAVKEEKAVIGKNLDKLAEDLQLKKESLDKLSQRLREFSDTHKELKSQLEGSKKQLESHSSLGVQAYSNKNLTNMKAQQTSLEAVQTQVDHLKSVAQSLVVDVPDTEGVTDLLLQADSLEKEHSSISKAVEDACSTLEDKLQGIGQFQNTIREMFTSFADFDDELDSMAPVGRDLETLRHQQGAIQSFISKLQDLMTNTASARDKCKKMLESEASPDLLGLKRDLEALSKQSGKLMDRANGRKEQVEDTLKHLEEFYSKLQTFTQKMTGAEEQEESQGPVGMETDVINQQLETFKVFQKEAIESLQTQLQDLNWLGQGLIQNAPKGTSTKSLEHDLEEVNTRWNTLNKKVAERSAQLHEALLHCGRFQDALESLLSWLTDTEELVASQKPPSAEFKVVKAQIQEQRLLQRLLDDRRPTVELIKKEGGKVTELADTADKEKIGREIECLGQRWDTLLKKAENRRKQLESILVVAQQFHETLEPLVEWLTATEKCLASSEPIGTQTSKLEEQIRQHKALEEEIIGRSKSLYQAMSLGQVLRTVSCMDDKELVQAKLDSTQSNYIELQERCRRKAELLQQALANAQLFGEDEVALMNWLDEVHCRLSDVSVQDYAPDVLDKQHAEQLALHEDIELRRQNVDQAMQNGLELLKQTTGDEVVVIQGKLDGIKTRYAEISTMSNSVLTTLNKALSLATKMQHTHEELSCWLEKVESELSLLGSLLNFQALMKEVQEHKPVVDTLNEVSSALLELVPWRAREGLDKLVTEDNERYRSASDAIAQHVDQTGAAILKSQQFEQAADTELAWLTEAERKLSSLGDIKLEPEQTTAQLQAQKGFSMDIMRHKDAVDDIVKTGEAILSSKDEAEKQALKAKVQSLLEKYNAVSQLNSERCLQLERAHSLACQFWETYEELWPWLQETQASFTQLPQPAIEYETLRQQQEELRQLRELIAEHKPHIDKMNKTGPQLVELSPVEGEPIRETYQATDKLYTQLKADVKHRAAALDEAISKSTQFHDKIDPMLESLERIAERLRQPPSISVEVEKIREQIAENKAVNMDLEKLQPSYETLKQRGEEMITRSEGADKDLSAKAVQDKLDQMVFVWNDIQALLEEREAKLLDVMDLAEKFWCDHCALIVTIKDTQDLLKELEEPGVDPSVVKQQQESVEGYREEIDGLQEELNVVQNLGAELMTACGEPDKPVIKKSLDEVNMAWETLNKTWKERVEQLEEAMQAAVQFQDGLQGMFDWVDILESKLDSMSPVGTDLETVKQQIEELKEFKGEAYQLQIEMERLNHQAGLLLKKVLEEADRITIQEPINELKMLWDNLDEKVINRQHKLEGALLALGQFQHALDELLAWLTHTEDLLSEQKKTSGDPKAIEIELAKHHVLQNDVLAHKSTVEAVNKAGSDLMESSEGEEACGLQTKLENLNQRWRGILEKTEQRRQLLDSALLQAQGFHGEIEDMQQWLKDTERQLLASKAVGGLPDTAREQLNAHLELCSAMEAKEELYQQLLQRGQQLIALTPEGQDSTTEQDLHNLQEKWECVQAKVAERKGKLEEALAMATDFHNSLQDFINWLTQAEQTLTMVSPASLILETILFQIDEHKVFVTEVNSHRDQIIELDKTGTHLKYFSQKQDVVLIKNLLLSVQSRWEKVVQRSVERGRLLDDARKRAKQFHESWTKLMEWLEESERALDSELEIANDPDKIKMQLAQHKEFQKALGGKHSVYDTTSRTGRALKDKTSLQDDNQKLDDMLCELRDKWDTVCGKSVERQNKLEEALLFSGQFTDALQALIDWLYKVEPQLAEDQPVHGDIDLVLNLIDSHKVFQKELGKRTGSVQALKRSARELIENSHDDSSWVKVQMQELSTRWETVCALSVSKQTRLEQALCQAEEFHSTVHILLEWLAEAEQSLRFHGSLPDDEEALRSLIEQHKEFMRKLEEKRVALGKATSMGEAILAICHPDSITTVKHWNTIIKARFEEVTAWARQHQQRLATALSELLATQELLESLLSWLQWAETTLTENDKEVLPQEIEEVKALIAEHQIFMEEMTRKQPDVDKVTKTHKRKATADPPVQSQIPVLDKGRTGRKRSPTQSVYPTAAQAQIETKNPRVNLLVSKWQQVWLLALDRRRKLNDALDRLEELKEFANFDFDVWRKRYMRWMNHKKSRVMDFFRRIDKDQDGKVTRQEFIEGILSSKFPTSRLEMSAVADIFDRDGDGYIDYYEFVAALHPNKDAYKPLTDADKIEDEVTRQVAKCKCPKRFQVEQIGANKYRHNEFINSQQLRLVRILRSTVMVRVGGGWMALDEFLVKNDPCRVHHHGSKMLRSESNSSITQSPIAKGRTNVELREKFILPEGTTQVMASFRYRGRRSRPSSRGASPNRSNSSHSCPAQPNPAAPGASKTPHLTRNYDKPWLTNSKSATPLKSSDSFESQGTPIQGSKLRLPGYLSGKGFQSGEEGTLINAAVLKAKGQAIGPSKNPSRPGSKAGSRGSSRRGSDASDFDISDIQSVCSDMSETVTDSGRPTPRSASRQRGGKPSKIPTPQRRSTPTSKLAKTTKR